MRYFWSYEFPICTIFIQCSENALTKISFSPVDGEKKETDLIKEVKNQLDEYFAGERKEFSLPLFLDGTEFQKKVWNALLNIPYGKTASYLDIARAAGNEKASRAVGMANNKNKIAIVIPCHRVIGSNGSLTGYAGGLDVKSKLLELEDALQYKHSNV